MPFILQPPDHDFAIRSVGDDAIVVNDLLLKTSFYLAPEVLHQDWRPTDVDSLDLEDLSGPISLGPEVILLGTGKRQTFPPAAILAACLTRGIGIEVMDNRGAARTFSILANEGRRVVAAFLMG